MCGACRVEVNKEAKFACVDGPEFDGHLVDWDIVEIRSRTFIDKEKMVMEGCTGGGCSCQR
jgi:ferredoxin--NADP+ reductase